MNIFIKIKKMLGKLKRRLESFYTTNNFILYVKWLFNKPKLPNNKKVLLHLGCGKINKDGFINIDKLPFPHIHYLSGVDKLPFLKNDSVDFIYISHCLEHIEMAKIPEVLKEYNRVLKKNGVLRISVPNLEVIIKMYLDHKDIGQIWEPLLGGQDYKYNFHFSVYDKPYLTKLLSEAGFSIIENWVNGQDEYTNFGDWSGRPVKVNKQDYPISLNLQATK